MKRFVEGVDRAQSTLFPECLDDWIGEESPVRVIDVFVDELDLAELGFSGVDPEATGRPSYHPAVLLKLYIYGYLNRVQSSRRLEREAGRNVEVMWLTGRLVPDHKTIADFRKDNGRAIRRVCARFVVLCRTIGLFTEASVAIEQSTAGSPRASTPPISRTPRRCSTSWHESGSSLTPRPRMSGISLPGLLCAQERTRWAGPIWAGFDPTPTSIQGRTRSTPLANSRSRQTLPGIRSKDILAVFDRGRRS
jgi:transposase